MFKLLFRFFKISIINFTLAFNYGLDQLQIVTWLIILKNTHQEFISIFIELLLKDYILLESELDCSPDFYTKKIHLLKLMEILKNYFVLYTYQFILTEIKYLIHGFETMYIYYNLICIVIFHNYHCLFTFILMVKHVFW